MVDSRLDTWMGLYSYCDPVYLPPNSTGEAYVCKEVPTLYLAAFTWSMLILTGTGGTDPYPSVASDSETFIVIVLNLFGGLLWTSVLAAFCDIATNSNPEETSFNQMLDDLNRFMANNRLPLEMQSRLRAYLHQRKHIGRAESAQHVLNRLSAALQIEVTLVVHGDWLRHLWFLKNAEHACLVQVASKMEPRVYAPGELPERKHLYVIERGIVLYAAKVLTSGKMWGEDIILESDQLHLEHVARAMTYVELYSLSRISLMRAIQGFPQAQRNVRRSAILVSLRREIIRFSKTKTFARRQSFFVDNVLKASEAQVVRDSSDVEERTSHLTTEEQLKELMSDLKASMASAAKVQPAGNGSANGSNGGGGGGGGGGDGALSQEVLEALSDLRHELRTVRDEQRSLRADFGALRDSVQGGVVEAIVRQQDM